jgi:thioesterase domain-containing protein/acyl carrier protein
MHDVDGDRVCGIFAEVFEVDSVAIDDDFFALGGDSLLATSLMAAIEKEFRVALPISVLLEAATPRAVQAAISAATGKPTGDALVVVNDEGTGPPLCCVHGMGGEAVFPRHLADSLGKQRPIYGFRAIGLLAGERPLDTVEEIASNYLAALRRVRPHGPYVVLGHCGGSMIAYEMAQQLVAAREPVAGLVLIDPAHNRVTAPYLFSSGPSLAHVQAAFRRHVAEIQAKFDAPGDLADGRRRMLVKTALHSAIAAYSPARFSGPTLLMYTTARKQVLLNPARGFPTLLSNCERVEVQSGHMNMFQEHMPELIAAIAAFLKRTVVAADVAPLGDGRIAVRGAAPF